MVNERKEKSNSWLIRLVFFLGIILAGLIIVAISKEMYKKKQVQMEIDKLKQEASSIEKQNLELSDKLSYLESKDYQEKEARDKLNLQNPGENVVVIKPNAAIQPQTGNNDTANDKKVFVRTSNVQKWWDYFFK